MANAAEWTERVAAWRASGLTADQFCAGRDFACRTLLRWSSELGRTAVGPTIRFARAVPVPVPVPKKPEIALARVIRTRAPVEIPGAAIVIVVDGARVEVGRGAAREVLLMVLDALSERSCG